MSGNGWALLLIAIVVVVLVLLVARRGRSGESASDLNPQPLPPAPPAEQPAPAAAPAPPAPAAEQPAPQEAADVAPPAPAPAVRPAASGPGYGPYDAGTAWEARAAAAGTDPALAVLDGGRAGPAAVGAGAAAAVGAAATQTGPYPGSALPTADGSAPSGDYTVKANSGSKRYHTTDSPYFHRNRADVWFASTDDAEAAGFVSWNGVR